MVESAEKEYKTDLLIERVDGQSTSASNQVLDEK